MSRHRRWHELWRGWIGPDLLFLRSRIAQRLLLLFVAAVLIPVAVTGGMAQTLLADASARLARQALSSSTEQLGMQVFERLLNARELARGWPDAAPAARAALAGLGRTYDTATLVDSHGRVLWTAGPAPEQVTPALGSGSAALRLVRRAGDTRVAMIRPAGDGRIWIAGLSDEYVWAPLRDAGDVPSWRVYTVSGQSLMTFGDDPPEPHTSPSAEPHGGGEVEWRMFLSAEFGAEDWVFAQHRELEPASLLGVRFELWLAAMTLGSLAAVGWLTLKQIRRLVGPLQRLTEVTHKLAAGDTLAHVEVGSGDELDELAQSFNEMSDRIRARERELSRRVTRDSLTGLANRQGLQQALTGLLAKPGRRFGLFYIDLDNFKQVNDSQGHGAGDELLREAAKRLAASLPEQALVARLGGDEFVALLPVSAPHEIQRYALRCRESLAKAFWLDGMEHFLGSSVGVALAPDHGRDAETLLRCADIAMYAVKRSGRNGHAVFEPKMDEQARHRVQLLRELRHALERREFLLHFQPRVNPLDGRVTSAEALLRWRHPERGLLMPGTFIAVAEESDLIEALGNWVLEEGCAQYARWQREGVTLARVSVNVSPRQLASGKLPAFVRQCLERYRVPPTAIELEVTESLLVGDVSRSAEQLAEIRSWGLSIALDDFGTGYSSLASLRQLPIDVIKIDRAFVRDLGRDESALAVVRTILTLADALKLHTVAEGIETAMQAQVLRELGCDEFQGYLYHKPMSVGAFSLLDGVRGEEPALA